MGRKWRCGLFLGLSTSFFKYPNLSVEIDSLGDRQRSRESDDPGIGEDQECGIRIRSSVKEDRKKRDNRFQGLISSQTPQAGK
jgi:hypothetical protein